MKTFCVSKKQAEDNLKVAEEGGIPKTLPISDSCSMQESSQHESPENVDTKKVKAA